jgi:hemerythrin-like domain-containing protein
MKATRLLMDEHKHILRALNVLEEMAACVSKRVAVDAHDLGDVLDFLRTYADVYHQGKEEAVLFPAMLKACGPPRAATLRHMIFEHDQERALMAGVADALRTKKGGGFVGCAERLIHLLRTHIYKEDHILFELADGALSATDDASVARALEAYDERWRDAALNNMLARLHDLEWKYLGRRRRTARTPTPKPA